MFDASPPPTVTSEPGGDDEPIDAEEGARAREYRTLLTKFWASALVSVPVLIFSYPQLLPGLRDAAWLEPGSSGRLWIWRGLGLLTLPILIWAGGQFYAGMWVAAKSRSANMHTLVGIGIAAAWLYPTVAVLSPSAFPSDRFAERCSGAGRPARPLVAWVTWMR